MTAMRQTPLTCSGHTRPVVHLAFSQVVDNEYFLISACKDGKPMLRKGDTGDWIGTFEGHKGAVWGVALNNDGSKAATGAADFQAKIWDAQGGDELISFPHQHIVKSVDFSPDGEMLLTGSNEKILRLFNIQRPDAPPLVFAGHTNNVRHVVFLKDSRRVASCSDDKTLRIWDLVTGKELSQLMFPSVPSSIEVFGDGQLISVTHGSSVSFWDTARLEKKKEFKVPCTVNSVSLHPDKSVFVCGGDDFKMYKNDFNSGVEIESFKGHFGPVHCVRFSPDGELYASGSEDGTLRLWQTKVGKSYGLWKGMDETSVRNGNKEESVFPEQV